MRTTDDRDDDYFNIDHNSNLCEVTLDNYNRRGIMRKNPDTSQVQFLLDKKGCGQCNSSSGCSTGTKWEYNLDTIPLETVFSGGVSKYSAYFYLKDSAILGYLPHQDLTTNPAVSYIVGKLAPGGVNIKGIFLEPLSSTFGVFVAKRIPSDRTLSMPYIPTLPVAIGFSDIGVHTPMKVLKDLSNYLFITEIVLNKDHTSSTGI